MSGPTRSERQRMGEELRRLRILAEISGRQLARRIGVNQSRLVRIEQGVTLPQRTEVLAWAAETKADEATRDRLAALAVAARTDVETWRELLAEKPHLQDDVAQREAAATLVQNFQPTVVPGLLQTPEYAHQVIPLADITGRSDHAAAAARRLERQQVLFDSAKRFEFVVTEGALRWAPSPTVLPAQLDRIVSLSGLENVTIGVLPAGVAVSATPWHNFTIYESDADTHVHVEAVHGGIPVTDPEDVELYRRLFVRLLDAAVTGPDAVRLIQRMATELPETRP